MTAPATGGPGHRQASSAPTSRGGQRRGRATRDAFLDAAERLFGRQGIEQTSVTDVATEAERSIGSLYHHFRDKSALVEAVVDRIADRLDAEITTAVDPHAWVGRSVSDIVAAYVAGALAAERDRPGYKRITTEASLADDDTRRRYRDIRARLNDGLTRLLLARRDEIGHPDPGTAVGFVVDQLGSMLTARLDREMTPTQLEDSTDEEFARACLDSARAYLRLRELPAPAGGHLASAGEDDVPGGAG